MIDQTEHLRANPESESMTLIRILTIIIFLDPLGKMSGIARNIFARRPSRPSALLHLAVLLAKVVPLMFREAEVCHIIHKRQNFTKCYTIQKNSSKVLLPSLQLLIIVNENRTVNIHHKAIERLSRCGTPQWNRCYMWQLIHLPFLVLCYGKVALKRHAYIRS